MKYLKKLEDRIQKLILLYGIAPDDPALLALYL